MEIENLSEDAEDFTGNIWKLSNGQTVLIDVGTGDAWKAIEKLEEIDKVVITHSHYDHVDNLPETVEKFGPEVYAFEPENLDTSAEKLSEGDEIELCGESFEVFHTPGHKNDSICLYSESGILFAGDLLFPDGGFGRTDLEEGDRELLIESIQKITELDVEQMYCGHDKAVTEEANSQIRKSLSEAEKRESKY
ncbi:MBL fold metallo-hydrolase [Candidatus Nanohalococcus occultus]|uniref:Hydroxyacylglutathione hydrolase n=1 Tax=Candidatus Nanohalococcus occultus TaxID=2978047 RepID=A0ABY8CJ14_9ARCH|nr:Hydroxyacylglutathione hydrolase [Candidatus Nanohaloarchaeota archaeon SVXNc]